MAKIDFDFFTDRDGTKHQELFENQVAQKCPQYLPNIKDCLANGIEITDMEFYSFALFENYNINSPDFSSFRAFEEIARNDKPTLDKIFSINGTIKFRHPGNAKQFICYAGCGGTLYTAIKLFNLSTRADYIRIPEQPGRPRKDAEPGENKTLDFEYLGTDGNRFIRVECKGKEGVSGSIQAKADDIMAKKEAQPCGDRDISFGIISVVPVVGETQNMKCILVDPDIPDYNVSPLDFRLYARLSYYMSRLSYLGRTKWLWQIRKFLNTGEKEFSFDHIKRIQSEKELLSKILGFKLQRPITNGYFFKLTVLDLESGDRVYARVSKTGKGEYLLYGFSHSFFDTLEYGKVSDFLSYKTSNEPEYWEGMVRVWDHYLSKEDVFLTGKLSFSKTGEVLGVLYSEHHTSSKDL